MLRVVRQPADGPAEARAEPGVLDGGLRSVAEDDGAEELGGEDEEGFRREALAVGESEADEDAGGAGGRERGGEGQGGLAVVGCCVCAVCAAAVANGVLALGDSDGVLVVDAGAVAATAAKVAAAAAADILNWDIGATITTAAITRRRQLHEIPVRDRSPPDFVHDPVRAHAEDGRVLCVAPPKIIDNVSGSVGEQLCRKHRGPCNDGRDPNGLGPGW